MPTIRQNDNRSLLQRTAEGSVFPLTTPTMLWIETHQPWARFVIHQSLTTTVVQIVWLSKSTLSPDEDLQCAVETSRSISLWQSWENDKTKPFYLILTHLCNVAGNFGQPMSKLSWVNRVVGARHRPITWLYREPLGVVVELRMR